MIPLCQCLILNLPLARLLLASINHVLFQTPVQALEAKIPIPSAELDLHGRAGLYRLAFQAPKRLSANKARVLRTCVNRLVRLLGFLSAARATPGHRRPRIDPPRAPKMRGYRTPREILVKQISSNPRRRGFTRDAFNAGRARSPKFNFSEDS